MSRRHLNAQEFPLASPTRGGQSGYRFPLRQLATAGLVVIVGGIVSLTLYRAQSAREQALLEARFRGDASIRASAIEAGLRTYITAQRSIAVFYASSQKVVRDEFAEFTSHLLENLPDIHAFHWSPRITGADRAEHERLGTEQLGVDYKITQSAPDGLRIRAADREAYYPIFFAEPMKHGTAMLGFDLGSHPVCRAAIEKVIQTAQPTVTDRVRLPAANLPDEDTVLIVVPVFHRHETVETVVQRQAHLQGCVIAVLPICSAIDSALANFDMQKMTTTIVDLSTGAAKTPIYKNDPGEASSPPAGIQHQTEIEIADRRWQVASLPTARYIRIHQSYQPTQSLVACLLITALTASIAYMIVNRTTRIEHVVQQRTTERDSFFTLSPDLMCVAGFDGYFKRLNPSWERVFGFSPEDMMAVPYFSFIHPDDVQRTIAEASSVAAGRTSVRFENRYRCKDGSYRTLVWSAAPMVEPQLVYAVARDVTDQKQSEQALRESEQRFQFMANNAPVMIWMADADGQYTFFNESWLSFTGRTMAQQRGRGWIEDVHPDDRARLEAFLRGADRATLRIEYRMRRADGEYRWVLHTGVPRSASDGLLMGFIGSCIDITELKEIRDELEQRVRERTTELMETNARLEEEIRHRKRINERLIVHQRNLRTLASELALAEERERQRIATGLHDEIGQAMALLKIRFRSLQSTLPPNHLNASREIQALLDSVIQSLRSLTFDFGSPTLYRFGIEAAIEQLCEQMQQKHDITTVFRDDDMVNELSNESRVTVYQSVREVMHNIVKHARATRVDVSVVRDNQHLVVTISDNGKGFDPDNLNPESRKMTGFGLFSIRERFQYLGGDMEIQSAPGRGATIVLRAPMTTTLEPSGVQT